MRRLEGLNIDRVSLVDKPATGFRFLVVKRQGDVPMKDDLKKLLAKFVSEEDLAKIADVEVPEAVQKSVMDALTKAEEYGDSIPEDLAIHLGKLSLGALLQVAPVQKDADEDGDGDEDEDGDKDKVTKKAGKPAPDDDALLSKVKALGEKVDKLGGKLDSLNEDLEEAFSVRDERLGLVEKSAGRGFSKQTPTDGNGDGDDDGGEVKKNAPLWPSWRA